MSPADGVRVLAAKAASQAGTGTLQTLPTRGTVTIDGSGSRDADQGHAPRPPQGQHRGDTDSANDHTHVSRTQEVAIEAGKTTTLAVSLTGE